MARIGYGRVSTKNETPARRKPRSEKRATIESCATSSVGRLSVIILAAVAEFERELIRKRVQDGVDKARAKGTRFDRKPVAADKAEVVRAFIADGWSKTAAAKKAAMSRAALYRKLAEAQVFYGVT